VYVLFSDIQIFALDGLKVVDLEQMITWKVFINLEMSSNNLKTEIVLASYSVASKNTKKNFNLCSTDFSFSYAI
jgi:hypothetical protein